MIINGLGWVCIGTDAAAAAWMTSDYQIRIYKRVGSPIGPEIQ